MKAIPQYPGYFATETGEIYGKRGELMSQMTAVSGHKRLKVCLNGKHKAVKVHTLVLLAFVGERPEGMEACHNDGNPANNRLDNLRWDTVAENRKDRANHGVGCKLSDTDVKDILWMVSMGLSKAEVGRMFGVSHQHVSRLTRGIQRVRVTAGGGL